jgi:hypothetical protein
MPRLKFYWGFAVFAPVSMRSVWTHAAATMMYLHASDESLKEVGDVFTKVFAEFGSDDDFTLVAMPGQRLARKATAASPK